MSIIVIIMDNGPPNLMSDAETLVGLSIVLMAAHKEILFGILFLCCVAVAVELVGDK